MALTLNLKPEIEQYLTQRAKEQGLSLESYSLGSMKKMRKNNKKQVNI